MSKTNTPEYIETPKRARRVRRIVTGVVLCGGIVAATLVGLSVPEPEPEARAAQVEAPEPPEWAQGFAPEPTPVAVVEAGEPEIEAPKPAPDPLLEIALEHDDDTTDFLHEARRLAELGEVKDALTAARKHVYQREATAGELHLVGTLARRSGAHDLAVQALRLAQELEPGSGAIHTELARAHLGSGALAEARTAAEAAVDLDRDSPAAWNLMGRVALSASKWQRADLAFRHALELDPTNPMYHNNAGLLYIYMKRGLDAVDALETAVELFADATPHFVFNNLGLAHEMAGNLEESRVAFEEALLLDPFYSKAKLNLERIEVQLAKRQEDGAFQTAQGLTGPGVPEDM